MKLIEFKAEDLKTSAINYYQIESRKFVGKAVLKEVAFFIRASEKIKINYLFQMWLINSSILIQGYGIEPLQ